MLYAVSRLNSSGIFQFETGNHKLFSKGLDDIVEEREQEVTTGRAISLSPQKGCQEAPVVELSGQEESVKVIQVTTSAAKGVENQQVFKCFIMIAETAKEKWAKVCGELGIFHPERLICSISSTWSGTRQMKIRKYLKWGWKVRKLVFKSNKSLMLKLLMG